MSPKSPTSAPRIMVMEHGVIKEMDSPTALLSRTDSVFYSMARDANLV